MSKINFTKIEQILEEALHEMKIDFLFEEATLANLTHEHHKTPSNVISAIISKFHMEMTRLKEKDPNLYHMLNLTPDEENRLKQPATSFTQADWQLLLNLKEKIEEYKKICYGQSAPDETQIKQIEEERKAHINKRFNVKKGWLPLK